MPPPSLPFDTEPVSRYSKLPVSPPDPILHLAALAKADPDPTKLDLSVGACTVTLDDGTVTTYTPPSVAEAARVVAKESHPYLPISGHEGLSKAAARLMFGYGFYGEEREKTVVSVSTVGGSGALRVALEFWRETCRERDSSYGRVWVADPTWPGHWGIPQGAGWNKKEIRTYCYDSICEDLQRYGSLGDLVILQSGAQNPTGRTLENSRWEKVLDVIKRNGMSVFWDVAYQGWGGNGLEHDVWPVRKSVELNLECFVCQSFSKSMGLYGERVGVLHVVSNDTSAEGSILSLLKKLIRNMYSSPPAFGARVASLVLNDEELRKQWKSELGKTVQRVESSRSLLTRSLMQKFQDSDRWCFLEKQRGMFAHLDLDGSDVDYLRQMYHIYLSGNGRLSLASLSPDRIEYFATAVSDTIRSREIG